MGGRKQREAPRHPSEVEMEQGHLDADSTITFDGPINHPPTDRPHLPPNPISAKIAAESPPSGCTGPRSSGIAPFRVIQRRRDITQIVLVHM